MFNTEKCTLFYISILSNKNIKPFETIIRNKKTRLLLLTQLSVSILKQSCSTNKKHIFFAFVTFELWRLHETKKCWLSLYSCPGVLCDRHILLQLKFIDMSPGFILSSVLDRFRIGQSIVTNVCIDLLST